MRTARAQGTALARRDTDERDHPSRGLVPLDGEPRMLEAYGHGLGGEPQLAVDALAEAPAVWLPDPDEVVNLHSAGLVLEEAGHDELVRGVERGETPLPWLEAHDRVGPGFLVQQPCATDAVPR